VKTSAARDTDRPDGNGKAAGLHAMPWQGRGGLDAFVLVLSDARLIADSLVDLLRQRCTELQFLTEDDLPHNQLVGQQPSLIILRASEYNVSDEWLSQTMKRMAIAHPDVPVMLISEHSVCSIGWNAIKQGFSGYLPTTQSGEQLIAALRVLIAGGAFLLHSGTSENILSSCGEYI
jgi:DNA-binding NarL/FixJ family response regulator